MSANQNNADNRPVDDEQQPEIMDDLEQADDQEISEDAKNELNAELTEVEALQKKYDETSAALEKEKRNTYSLWQSLTISANAMSRRGES